MKLLNDILRDNQAEYVNQHHISHVSWFDLFDCNGYCLHFSLRPTANASLVLPRFRVRIRVARERQTASASIRPPPFECF